ncbi:TetR/AcrR family transcriptional regulator [Nocardioides sp. R-C-SC26]|uniref:TetR/AcrR family transcriptional regulator n=1 Tax=Nocardioides sp. R-C-SC26 TaxID=2870414 RepID=UPI001E579F7C|nr:TetR/AcrR family transcriptional regulator [Nocardioides sp. R-C-SC26]
MTGSKRSVARRTYGGQTADERRADRRQRLVDAVIAELAVPGQTVTMTGVCASAGLTERYFYESFASLDALLVEALETVATEILAVTTTAAAATSGPASRRVQDVVEAFARYAEERPERLHLIVISSQAYPHLRTRRAELLDTFGEAFAVESAAIYGEHAWPARRAKAHGMAMVAGLAELFAAQFAGTLDLSREELIDSARAMFEALGSRHSPV